MSDLDQRITRGTLDCRVTPACQCGADGLPAPDSRQVMTLSLGPGRCTALAADYNLHSTHPDSLNSLSDSLAQLGVCREDSTGRSHQNVSAVKHIKH